MPIKKSDIHISLFYCSNTLKENELSYINSMVNNVNISAISLPCSGKADLLYLLKAIETGSDGLLLVSCKLGECKYLQGNFRAQKRMEYVNDLLAETGLGKKHVKFISMENDNKIETIISSINNMAETFRHEMHELQK
jgi:coenzyme F420-reducing hydrogenase delta subunit